MLWLRIVNDDTGNEKTAHYDVVAGINNRELGRCRVEDFNRPDGWVKLLQTVTTELENPEHHTQNQFDYQAMEAFLRSR